MYMNSEIYIGFHMSHMSCCQFIAFIPILAYHMVIDLYSNVFYTFLLCSETK